MRCANKMLGEWKNNEKWDGKAHAGSGTGS